MRTLPDVTLSATGIVHSYGGEPALSGVDLSMYAGEIVALLGLNGAGKSTLISILCNVLTPTSGTVAGEGDSVPRRGLIGCAPQELGLYLSLTARQNLEFFGELNGVPKKELPSRVREVAACLDLAELLDRSVRNLSGGEQRRVQMGTACIHRPAVLLLDEPTAGVDVLTRQRVLETVSSLAAEGTAILYTTHYLPEVEVLNARTVILDSGTIIAEGTVPDLIERHGGSAIELTFVGDAPPLRIGVGEVVIDGSTVQVRTSNPSRDLSPILQALGSSISQLKSIETIAPGLEAVFLAITGRRFEQATA